MEAGIGSGDDVKKLIKKDDGCGDQLRVMVARLKAYCTMLKGDHGVCIEVAGLEAWSLGINCDYK